MRRVTPILNGVQGGNIQRGAKRDKGENKLERFRGIEPISANR